MRNHRSLALAVVTVAGLAPAALAQDVSPTGQPLPGAVGTRTEGAFDGLRFTLVANTSHAFRTDLRGSGDADTNVTRGGVDLGINFAAAENLSVGVDLGVEGSWYSLKGDTQLVPGTGQPWSDMYSVSMGPSLRWRLDDKWNIIGSGFVNFSGESDADWSEALTGGGLVAVAYSFSRDFTLSAGVAVSSRLEDSTLFVPIVGIDWKISPTMRLVSRGLGLEFSANLATNWQFLLFGRYESRAFRLEENSRLPSGVFRDKRVPVGAGVQYTFGKDVSLRLDGGMIVWSEFETIRNGGQEFNSRDLDGSAFIGASLSLRF
jgi:opacity protein-like surface antigen